MPSSSRLFDVSSRKCLLTWSNRQPLNHIAKKLDRALSNEAWWMFFLCPQRSLMHHVLLLIPLD